MNPDTQPQTLKTDAPVYDHPIKDFEDSILISRNFCLSLGVISIPASVFRECVVEGKGREEVEQIKNADWIKVSNVNDKKLVRMN